MPRGFPHIEHCFHIGCHIVSPLRIVFDYIYNIANFFLNVHTFFRNFFYSRILYYMVPSISTMEASSKNFITRFRLHYKRATNRTFTSYHKITFLFLRLSNYIVNLFNYIIGRSKSSNLSWRAEASPMINGMPKTFQYRAFI